MAAGGGFMLGSAFAVIPAEFDRDEFPVPIDGDALDRSPMAPSLHLHGVKALGLRDSGPAAGLPVIGITGVAVAAVAG
jgi:hypothetical protein